MSNSFRFLSENWKRCLAPPLACLPLTLVLFSPPWKHTEDAAVRQLLAGHFLWSSYCAGNNSRATSLEYFPHQGTVAVSSSTASAPGSPCSGDRQTSGMIFFFNQGQNFISLPGSPENFLLKLEPLPPGSKSGNLWRVRVRQRYGGAVPRVRGRAAPPLQGLIRTMSPAVVRQ